MKILITGATGSIGSVVAKRTLSAGHEVIALVRTPSKLGDIENKVTVVEGDLSNLEKLEQAMKGIDLVFHCAGPMGKQKNEVEIFTLAIQNIVAAMEKNNIRRIVAINGALTPVEGDKIGFFLKFIRIVMKKMLATVVKSNIQQIAILSQSKLDWTAVRASMITNDPASKSIKADKNIEQGMKVSREDIATFFLEQISDTKFLHAAPFISAK